MNKLILSLISLLSVINLFGQSQIYLHTDRSVYNPGETIFFSGVVRNEALEADTSTNLLYIELYNSFNDFVKSYLANIQNGRVSGQIELSEYMPLGSAYLKAFVGNENYNKYYYKLPIAISSAKSVPLVANSENNTRATSSAVPMVEARDETTTDNKSNFLVSFYPEAGDLIANSGQKVGVSITNTAYLPMSAKGEIRSKDGSESIPFETDENGLGLISNNFKAGKSYKAYLNEGNKESEFEFPKIKASGNAIAVSETGDKYIANVSTEGENMQLAVYALGKVVQSQVVNNGSKLEIEKRKLPGGVARIRLIKNDTVPLCERLVFKPYYTPDISIEFDKTEYTSGGILIYDLLGPEGEYSVSFTDLNYPVFSQLIQPSIDKSLLFFNALKDLNPNLGGYSGNQVIESPDQIEKMLLTYGWRSFESAPMQYEFGDELYFKGRVLNALTKRPQKETRVVINIKKGFLARPLSVMTDEEGAFEVNLGKFNGEVSFKIAALSKSGRAKDAILELETNRHKWVYDNTRELNLIKETIVKNSEHPVPMQFAIDESGEVQLAEGIKVDVKGAVESRIASRRVENEDYLVNDTVQLLTEFVKQKEAPLTERELIIQHLGRPIKSISNEQLKALNKDVNYNSVIDYALAQWTDLVWVDPGFDNPECPNDYFKYPYRLTMKGDQTQPVFVLLNGERYYYGENPPAGVARGEVQGLSFSWDYLQSQRDIIDAINLGSVRYIDLIKVENNVENAYDDFESFYFSGDLGYAPRPVLPYVLNIIYDNTIASDKLEFAGTITPKQFYRFHQIETPPESLDRITTKTVMWYPDNKVNKTYGFELNKVNGDTLVVVQGMSDNNEPFSLNDTVKVSLNKEFLRAEVDKAKEEEQKEEAIVYDAETMEADWITEADFVTGRITSMQERTALQNIIVSTPKGVKTLTNKDGEFAYPTDYLADKDMLNVYGADWQTKAVPQAKMGQIALKEDTVRYTNEALAVKDMRKIYRNTLNKRKNELAELFYREKVFKNRDLYALNEYQLVYKISRTTGDDKYISMFKKARTMEAPSFGEEVSSRPRTSQIENIYDMDFIMNPPAFLDQFEIDKFEFTVVKEATLNDRLCNVVSFDQKDGVREALQSGTIWVDKEEDVILYLEFGFSEKGVQFFDPLVYMTQSLTSDMKPGDIRWVNSFSFKDGNVFLDYASEFFIVESPTKRYQFEKEMVAVKSYNVDQNIPWKPLSDLKKSTLLVKTPKYNAAYWMNIPFILPEEAVREQVEFLKLINLYTGEK